METTRQQKISRLLQRDLGEIFQLNSRKWIPGLMVTVTKVRISRDLSLAKIYLSLFATKDKIANMEVINKNKSEIRKELGNRVRHQLRIVPELCFFLDDSLDYIDRIEKALKE